jgi:hypothetical protein
MSPLAFAAAAALRVLFIGNSLTTANDLPDMVRQLAVANHRAFEYRVVAFGGYSLEDHWNRGDARRVIAEGGWTYVVLQQGPSALPESRVSLVDYARRFAAEIRRVGAEPALYMVWPSTDRSGDVDGVSQSYTAAAHEARGLLLPAGDAWRAAFRRNGKLALYGPDGFHPTAIGSYLAALVMFDAFFRAPPAVDLPSIVSSADARVLHLALEDVRTRNRPVTGPGASASTPRANSRRR